MPCYDERQSHPLILYNPLSTLVLWLDGLYGCVCSMVLCTGLAAVYNCTTISSCIKDPEP